MEKCPICKKDYRTDNPFAFSINSERVCYNCYAVEIKKGVKNVTSPCQESQEAPLDNQIQPEHGQEDAV